MSSQAVSRVLRGGVVVVLLPALASVYFTAAAVHESTAGSDGTAPAGVDPAIAPAEWRPLDPAKVEGHAKCIDCHKSEVAAWLQSKHAAGAFDMLRSRPNSREYARKMGISMAHIAKDSVCTNCHATRQLTATGGMHTLGGISCESCHNVAGGEDGWLNLHAVYGPPGTRREEESPDHFQRRVAECRKRGQYGSSDVYALAKSCYQCHLVPDEKLVTQSGHPQGNFELVEWTLGEVRHNFHMDQRQNAEAPSLWMARQGAGPADRKRLLYIVGQLVDIELSLRSFGKATDPSFATAAGQRVVAAHGVLTGVNSVASLPEVQTALDAVAKVMDKLFQPPAPEQEMELDETADQVAAAAKKVGESYDGSTLMAIDDFMPPGQKGAVFQPK